MACKNVAKAYEVDGSTFWCTSKMQEMIDAQIRNINDFNNRNDENPPDVYKIVFRQKTIDGIAINDITDLLKNITKTVFLIFDHCNIKNMEFTNIYLVDLPIKFLNCSIDRITFTKSRFRLVNFISCNIFELQAFGCYFFGSGLDIASCSVNALEIKCCQFEEFKIFGSNIDMSTIHYNTILEANLSNTLFVHIWTINNKIDWERSDNIIRSCYFKDTDDAENPIITIDGVGVGTFYYLPTLDFVKREANTWKFEDFKSYINGLNLASETIPDNLDKERHNIELKSLNAVVDYIARIREDYNETKLLKEPEPHCELYTDKNSFRTVVK